MKRKIEKKKLGREVQERERIRDTLSTKKTQIVSIPSLLHK